MKELEGYKASEIKALRLKTIKDYETLMCDKALGATFKDGSYNYEFALMMNETRRFLEITKPGQEFEQPIPPDNNKDITIGDINQ